MAETSPQPRCGVFEGRRLGELGRVEPGPRLRGFAMRLYAAFEILRMWGTLMPFLELSESRGLQEKFCHNSENRRR